MRHDGGNTLKYQDHRERLRTLPLNPMECGKSEVEQTKHGAFPGNGRVSRDHEELQRLRDENKRLRMERDILKKALGFFASASS